MAKASRIQCRKSGLQNLFATFGFSESSRKKRQTSKICVFVMYILFSDYNSYKSELKSYVLCVLRVLLHFVTNDVTDRMVYRVFFLERNV